MPRYETTVAHGYGRREATARLKHALRTAPRTADFHERWTGDTLAFDGRVQGIRLRGAIRVEDGAIHLDMQLPLVAMPFAGWIPRVLKVGLSTYGGGREGPEPSAVPASGALAAPGDPPAGDADRAVLFLHIPKAAGSTFADFICGQWCTSADRQGELAERGIVFATHGFFGGDGDDLPAGLVPLLGRPDLRAVIGHFRFGLHERVARPSTYVTVLREPVARVVSLYRFLKLDERMSLEAFAASPPFREAENDQTRRIAGLDPGADACTGAALEAAKDNLRRHFAVVGVSERLDETAMVLKRRLGWTRDLTIRSKNVNPVPAPAGLLSSEAVTLIRERNAFDLDLYDFAVRLLDEAIVAEGPDFGGALARERTHAAPRGR